MKHRMDVRKNAKGRWNVWSLDTDQCIGGDCPTEWEANTLRMVLQREALGDGTYKSK